MDLNHTNLNLACPNASQFPQLDSTIKLRFSPAITIIFYTIYLFPFCFGVFGNASVCLIFFQQKKLRSITNTFLMNLCVNDLIVLCVSIPMTLSTTLLEHWVFGAFLCKFVHFTPTVTALVSTFTVAVIAVERWFFIVNKRKFDRRCTILTLILLWLVSVLIALPEFLFRNLQEDMSYNIPEHMMSNKTSVTPKNTNVTDLLKQYNMTKSPCKTKKNYYCVLKPDLRTRIFSYFVITVQYLVPFLFVSVSCYSISRFLKRRMIRMRSYQTSHRLTRNSSKNTRKKSLSARDDTTEQDVTSCDDLPSTTLNNEVKSSPFLSRFSRSFRNRQDNSVDLVDPQHILRYQSHTKRRFHRSRKLLIYVAALFTISWLPLTVVQFCSDHYYEILLKHLSSNGIYGYLFIPSYLISSLSAWINPVIYNYINRSFRREFYSLYSCCFKARTSNVRKEITTIGTKRCQQSEATQINGMNNAQTSRLTLRQSTQAVSFAHETTVMMHTHT